MRCLTARCPDTCSSTVTGEAGRGRGWGWASAGAGGPGRGPVSTVGLGRQHLFTGTPVLPGRFRSLRLPEIRKARSPCCAVPEPPGTLRG